ncbi:hypothetical protein [Acidicapsa acidisoli]|uniref:hypothetical protein n=1 Tax=Acidicapsa acidisoli TaxID=1615681 RepID=UPI0021E0D5A4|nr:hypothetical protein [Acidicapsa acidisoli]
MPLFEKCLKASRIDVNKPVAVHLVAVRKVFPSMFPGQGTQTEVYLQEAVKAGARVLRKYSIGTAQEETAWSLLGNTEGRPPGAQMRDAFCKTIDEVLTSALDALEPAVKPSATPSSWSSIRKSFPVASLERRLEPADKTKICAIYDRGKGYKGHGPTRSLGAGVLHAHVGNGTGVAFKWEGDSLAVYAVGEKSDKAPEGSSGYNWTAS